MPPRARTARPLDPAATSVLIVDDQAFVRGLLADVLRNFGVTNIHVANDGETGLETLIRTRPDVVFTDWVMPNLDGIAFAKAVRDLNDPQLQQVPIILVTALNQRSQIEFARASGIDEFVLKPISAKAIGDRLRKVVEHPRPFVSFPTYVGPCRRRRADPDFLGPYRRYDDPIEIDGDASEAEQDSLRGLLHVASARVKELISGQNGAANNIRAIHMAVSEMQAIAEELGDEHLSQVFAMLISYLVAANRAGRISGELIALHVSAVTLLIRTPTSHRHACDEIVSNLQHILKHPAQATSAA
ncbi:MAG: hypothetical protein RL186_477 [Pseudomonadota bacterium]